MYKIITFVGARHQIIKEVAESKAIINFILVDKREFKVHSVKHYENNISKVFFDGMKFKSTL
jgi:hypothetical protein